MVGTDACRSPRWILSIPGRARDCRTEAYARLVLRFSSRHRRWRPLQSPLPCPSAARAAQSWSFVAQPAVPIERVLFCRPSSQVLSVEWPVTVPALRLTPPPGWIAAGRFAQPFLGRRRPTGRYTAAGSVGHGVVRPGSKRYRAAQSDSLPYPAAARFLLGSCPAWVFHARGLASQSSLRALVPLQHRRV